MLKNKNKIPLLAGIIYIIILITAVAIAWLSGKHLYDMSISFSSYVGMTYFTSVMYFIGAVSMTAMLGYYIAKTKPPAVKQLVYAAAFVCIFGTALFPFNYYSDHPTAMTIDLHNYFAEGLMFAVTVSFILTVILAKNKKQRIIAVLSLLYAAVFIVLYMNGVMFLFRTFFIWENLFIVLLLIGLHMEQYSEKTE